MIPYATKVKCVFRKGEPRFHILYKKKWYSFWRRLYREPLYSLTAAIMTAESLDRYGYDIYD